MTESSETMEIKMSNGATLIDSEDFNRVNGFNWFVNRQGKRRDIYYVVAPIKINKKWTRIRIHRLILNANIGEIIDHINGDGLDNRKCNLRFCTHQQNIMNRRITNGTSKYKGVGWHKGANKWQVQICFNYKLKYLGLYTNEIDAAHRYNEEAIKLFGEFAKLNEIY